MQLREAIEKALKEPIGRLGKFIITRQGMGNSTGAMFLSTDEDGACVVDMRTGEPCAHVGMHDILAEDWDLLDWDVTGKNNF